jgi:hypothetical protein
MFAQTRIIHYYVCLGAASGKECKVFMKILLVSDSHGYDDELKKVLERK